MTVLVSNCHPMIWNSAIFGIAPRFLQVITSFDGFLAAGGASCNQAKNHPAGYGFPLCRFAVAEPPFFCWIAAPLQPL
jgi:hypothetical protein